MKIIITEQQTEKLTDSLINEQGEMTGIVDLANFLRSLQGNKNDDKSNTDVDTTSDITIPENVDFNVMVKLVIDRLEGGYYHPNMLNDGRVKDRRYRRSGETMFGIDRIRGGDINRTGPGRQFWSIIDNANARNTWKWNYDGGSLKSQLQNLVAQMIEPLYISYSNRYLSPEASKIVNNNKGLTFNFIYATWNGPAWFKKFANKVNDAVMRGVTSPNELSKVAVQARKQSGNSLISQSGDKINDIMTQLA